MPSILQNLMTKLFPAPADATDALPPDAIAGARARALGNIGASLLRTGGPAPTGTRNFGSNVGQALQDANWPGVLDEAAARAQAFQSIAGKAAGQRAIQEIMAKHPATPGETPEEAMARFESMVPDLVGAGLYDQAAKIQQLVAASRPKNEQYVKAGPGETIYGPKGAAPLVPVATQPAKPAPDKALDIEHTLYGEFTPQAQPYRDTADAYRSLQSYASMKPDPNFPGTRDQGLLFSYMRMLSPQLALQPGQRAPDHLPGTLGEIAGAYNLLLGDPKHKMETGERQQIIASAESLLRSRAAEFQRLYSTFVKRAQDAQVDPDHVVYDYFAGISGIPKSTGVGAEGDAVLSGGSR